MTTGQVIVRLGALAALVAVTLIAGPDSETLAIAGTTIAAVAGVEIAKKKKED